MNKYLMILPVLKAREDNKIKNRYYTQYLDKTFVGEFKSDFT